MTYTYETEIELGGDIGYDCPIVVTYSKTPFVRGSTDGRFGPKLEPDEPAGIEIESIVRKDTGDEITLTNAQEDRICEKINASLDDGDDCPEDH